MRCRLGFHDWHAKDERGYLYHISGAHYLLSLKPFLEVFCKRCGKVWK